MKTLRLRIKWSQHEMAKYLGVSQPTIARVENGKPESGPIQRLLDQLAEQHPENDALPAPAPEQATAA